MATSILKKNRTRSELAAANDTFRRTFQGGWIFIAGTLMDHPRQREIVKAVREFDGFHTGDGRSREHDFAVFRDGGEKVYFKITYWDENMKCGANRLKDAVIKRTLTICLAGEM